MLRFWKIGIKGHPIISSGELEVNYTILLPLEAMVGKLYKLKHLWPHMKVHIERTNEDKLMEFKGNAGILLKKLKLNPESILIVRNGELVNEDAELKDNDEIKILSVVSGG